MAVWCDKSDGKYSEENGDQMRRGPWIIFGMLVVLLTGCSGKKTAEVLENAKNAESTDVKNTLDFVDAHGERYTVEINEAVAKNPYDNALFVKNENINNKVYNIPE